MASALGARLKSGESLGDRVIKVNHAGEHGAINIYHWQRAIARWLKRRGRSRCRSYHLCGLGGMGLGIVTGLLGAKAIHATTEAIERVVLRHLKEQLRVLGPSDPEAKSIIAQIVADEQAHHDIAAQHLSSKRGILERAIEAVVADSTEAVIWLGMKL